MLLTRRRQRQAIRNHTVGQDIGVDPDLLGDDYYYLYQVVTDLAERGFDESRILLELNRVAMQEQDLTAEVLEITRLEPRDNRRQYLTLRDIGQNLPEITWFWPGWIPRGFLTTIAAEPGVGKTNMALDLSKRVIHGLLAPDQRQELDIRTGAVIYIEAENFLSGLYERAEAWQINMDRLIIFPQNDDLSPKSGEQPDPLNLADPDTQTELMEMASDLNPDLIIIDSFSSINVKGENAIEDTRDILHFFGWLSVRFDCAVVLLHHLRKPQKDSRYNRVTQHDLRGSSHIVAMSRSIIGMWITSLDQNGPRRIEVIKANLAPAPPPLALTYHTNGHDLFDMLFDPLSEPDLPHNLAGECAEWLEEILAANGPMSYIDLKSLAEEAGFKENTLQNARSALGWKIIDTKGVKAKGNQWALFDGDGPPKNKIQHDEPDDEPESDFTNDRFSECLICHNIFEQPAGRGRRRVYCSDACRAKARFSQAREIRYHMADMAMCERGGGSARTGGCHTWPCDHVIGEFRALTLGKNGHFWPPKYHPPAFRQFFIQSRPAPRSAIRLVEPAMCGQGNHNHKLSGGIHEHRSSFITSYPGC